MKKVMNRSVTRIVTRSVIEVVLGVVIGVLLCYKCTSNEPIHHISIKDSLVIDTQVVRLPIFYDSTIISYQTIPIVDSIRKDTTIIQIPISQKIYKKDSLYKCWVSGFNPKLDSIIVYPKTNYITKTVKIKPYSNQIYIKGTIIPFAEEPCYMGGVSYNRERWEYGLMYGRLYNQNYIAITLGYRVIGF